MSISKVFRGAPDKTALTPPTTMKSTLWRHRQRRISKKSGAGDTGTQLQDRTDVTLENLQTFSRGHVQHPVNQRDVNAVVSVVGAGFHPNTSLPAIR